MTAFTSNRSTRAACAQLYSPGLVRAGDPGQVVWRRRSKQDSTERGLVFLHGAGVAGNFITFGHDVNDQPNVSAATQTLVDAGFILVGTQRSQGGTIGVNTFGNDTTRTQLAADRTFLQTPPGAAGTSGGGAFGGKIGIVAFSMGGVEAFNLVKQIGAANVAGVVTIEGTTDMTWLRGADADNHTTPGPGYFYDSIQAAYTGDSHNPHSGTAPTDSDWATIKAEHDPMVFAASSANVPLLAYINQDDVLVGGTLAPTTLTEQFAATLTSATVKVHATGGHTWLNVSASEIIAFFDSLSW